MNTGDEDFGKSSLEYFLRTSLALHKAVGAGTCEKHGKVGSQWRDCVIKLLNNREWDA